MVKIAFVVERPTQFEVPLFRYAAKDPADRLRVLFTNPSAGGATYDPELTRSVDWGFDLREGYDHVVAPSESVESWMRKELSTAWDLVIVNGYTQPAYRQAARLARRSGIPTALRLDSALFEPMRLPRRLGRRFLFLALNRLFDFYLGVGSSSAAYLAACGVPLSRRGEFPYAVDTDWFAAQAEASAARERIRDRFSIAPDRAAVLAVAKLHPRETPWDLLHALARHPAQRPPFLLLAGDGPERADVEQFLARRDSLGAVLGYVPYTELPGLYSAVDLFVHAPQEERWGVSVGEAMSCGLPVVTGTRVGAGHDLIVAGRNGFLYESGNAQELGRSITAALELDRTAVESTNRERLERWGYSHAWKGLVNLARRASRRQIA